VKWTPGGDAPELPASSFTLDTSDECVRAVVQPARQPDAHSDIGRVVGRETDHRSSDCERSRADAEQMNDDRATRGSAPVVHDAPVEHIDVTRARVLRGRAESGRDQVRSDAARPGN